MLLRILFFILLVSCVRDDFEFLERKGGSEDLRLGWKFPSESTVRHRRYYGNQIIFDVLYHSGLRGTRVTKQNDQALSHLILIGGSNTFGEGVSDFENFGWLLGQKLISYQVYNFGDRGYSPGHALIQLRDRIIARQVQEEEGTLVYFFIPDLILRVIPSWHYRLYADKAPLFEMNQKNELVYRGATQPLSEFYNNWLFKKIMSLFDQPGVIDFKLCIRILEEIKKSYLEQFPKGNFVLMLDPFSSWDRRFLSQLAKSNLFVYRPLTEGDLEYHFPHDHHLNSKGHQVIANLLFRAITQAQR